MPDKDCPLKVLGARCVVLETKLSEVTDSGIIVPGRDEVQTQQGIVLEVGEGALLENGTLVPMQVAVGDNIVFASFAGTPIEVDDDTYLVLNERDILAIICK